MLRVEQQDPIGRGFENGVEVLVLAVDLGVQAGIVDGDRRLRGEGLEQTPVFGRVRALVRAEDEDDPRHPAARDHRQADAVEQAHRRGAGDPLQAPIDLR